MTGGKPCIRSMRFTVGMIIGFLASCRSEEYVLSAYPCLEAEGIRQALAYAAWSAQETAVSLDAA